MTKTITTNELYEAIGAFAESMDQRFDRIESTMATKQDLERYATKEDLELLRKEMATKGDLSRLRDDLRDEIRQESGRIISLFSPMMYKADRKVNTLMERLVAKRSLARSDIKDLLEIHPLSP